METNKISSYLGIEIMLHKIYTSVHSSLTTEIFYKLTFDLRISNFFHYNPKDLSGVCCTVWSFKQLILLGIDLFYNYYEQVPKWNSEC